MKNLLQMIASSLGYGVQHKTPFRHARIGSSCSLYLPIEAGDLTCTATATPDAMHFGETMDAGGVTYGFITICLNAPVPEGAAAQALLSHFMRALHPSFGIVHTTGEEGNLPHVSCWNTRGLVDYWQDADGVDWKVKGWTNGSGVAVLYVRNINKAEACTADIFLDSILFH